MRQLYTRWGENLDKENVLGEYPRPLFKRDSYMNLNGGVGVCVYKRIPAARTFSG